MQYPAPPHDSNQPPSYNDAPPSYNQASQPNTISNPAYKAPAANNSYGQPSPYGQPPSAASYGQNSYGQPPAANYGQSYGQPAQPSYNAQQNVGYGQQNYQHDQPKQMPQNEMKNGAHSMDKFNLAMGDQQNVGGKGTTQPTYEGGYNDIVFAILFVLHLLIVLISAVAEAGNANTSGNSSIAGPIGLCVFMIFTGAVLGWLSMSTIRRYTKTIINTMMILQIAMCGCFAILMFLSGSIFMGVVFLFFTAILYWYKKSVQSRIPFATACLRIAVNMSKAYPAMVYLSLAALIFDAIWIIWWAAGFYGYNESRNPSGGVLFLWLISFYWTLEVIKNVVHVTVAGVCATWYNTAEPQSPTKQSLKRATTTSFGSVCFGSLVLAIVRALRAMAESQRDGDGCGAFIAICLLNCLETIVEYVNVYAFSFVAIYGDSYIQGAKKVWQLFKSAGITAIINDDLVGYTVFAAALVSGLVTGGLSALIARFMTGDSDMKDQWVLWGIIGVLVGFFMCTVVLNVLLSAISTLFCCWADDPATLFLTHPDEGKELADASRTSGHNLNGQFYGH